MSLKYSQLTGTIGLLFFAVFIKAQTLPVPGSETSNEDRQQVVCYAEDDRWVCAPKGTSKEQAQAAAPVKSNDSDAEPENAAINPLDQPEGVEAYTDTAPSKVNANPMQDTPSDALSETAPKPNPETQSIPTAAESPSPVEIEATAENKAKQPTNTPVVKDGLNGNPESNPNDNTTEPNTEFVTTTEIRHPRGKLTDWLQQNPNAWGLQILGVANQQNIQAFVDKHALQSDQFAVVETERDDASWWVVLLGPFEDRDAAVTVRSQLKDELSAGAWPRPLNTLNPIPK